MPSLPIFFEVWLSLLVIRISMHLGHKLTQAYIELACKSRYPTFGAMIPNELTFWRKAHEMQGCSGHT